MFKTKKKRNKIFTRDIFTYSIVIFVFKKIVILMAHIYDLKMQ